MTNAEIEKKLESKNVKPTAMRTLVYKALVDSGKALSLGDLELRFEKVPPYSGRLNYSRTIISFILLMTEQVQ
jgi:Fe2+ or Zn2+ uptake regulation protein